MWEYLHPPPREALIYKESWCLRQESNLYLALRRHSFYPLNYGGDRRAFYLLNMRMASSSPLSVMGYMRLLISC